MKKQSKKKLSGASSRKSGVRVATLKNDAKKRLKPKRRTVVHGKKEKTSSHATYTQEDLSRGVYRAKIRIVAIGGGAGNILSEIAPRVFKVDFIAANTDAQALKSMHSKIKTVGFGGDFTQGLGCGMDPEIGEKAARAEKEKIKKVFEGQDVVILIATLGGGTGSGALPIFAQAAQEAKCMTLGIFTMPFRFEGEKRQAIAKTSLEKVKPLINAYVVLPNERIFSLIEEKTPLTESFSIINRYLADSLEGLVETIYLPGVINTDFADLKALLEGRGRLTYLSSVMAGGTTRVQDAVQQVANNPLSEYGIEGTERMLFNVASDRNVKMHEIAEVSNAIANYNPKAKIIFGISYQPRFKDKIRVTLFTVGCRDPKSPKDKREKTEDRIQEQEGEEVHVKEKKKKKRKIPLIKKEQTLKQDSSPHPEPIAVAEHEQNVRIRRTGLELKRAADKEMEELEQREKEWEVPAFLRNRSI